VDSRFPLWFQPQVKEVIPQAKSSASDLLKALLRHIRYTFHVCILNRSSVHDYQPGILPGIYLLLSPVIRSKACVYCFHALLSFLLDSYFADTMLILRLTLTVLFLFLPSLLAQTQCYYPDGSHVNSAAYQPCNLAIGTASMCCAIGPGAADPADQCLSNGLCKGYPNGTQLWRDSCTDHSWKSPFCLQLCTRGFGIHLPSQ